MDRDRVENILKRLAECSSSTEGVTRLAFSEEDANARQIIIDIMHDIGLKVRVDSFGNIIGRLDAGKSTKCVAMGSHIDTVPNGGMYDGTVGVVGALAAVDRLKGKADLVHSVEVIVFCAEESSRFGFATMGSKAVIGKVNYEKWLKAKDKEGVTFTDAFEKFGLNIADIGQAQRKADEFIAFLELHIEQGKILENTGHTIGVVKAIAAPTRMRVTVNGVADHSGATPMGQRKDALTAAAELILAVEEIAQDHADKGTVGTVGVLHVEPGAINVVPGKVKMMVDVRGVNYESIMDVLREFKQEVARVADEREIHIVVDILSSERPIELNENVVALLEDICNDENVNYIVMDSGAGHDAMNMAELAPTGMIFIPCREGISHNPNEYANIDDIMKGIDVLTEAVYRLAKQ